VDPSTSRAPGSDRPLEVDHAGLEVLDADECRDLLASATVGRLAFVEDGDPVALPVNIGWWHGDVVFSTQRGSKLEAAVSHHRVAVEVDGWDPDTGEAWSVLVRGIASKVTDGRDIDSLDRLSIRSWVRPGLPKHWVAVRPSSITGRRSPV
jgi:nitroimidazol reductase NimA-like FMN-containing flavoprotein (pyridoxamine 5'-phosphate oxidase superfamily)